MTSADDAAVQGQQPPQPPTALDRVYDVGVVIKGIDGALELLIGVLLWLAPGALAGLLGKAADDAAVHHSETGQFFAHYAGRLDDALVHSSLTFVIVFLILHGLVKLALVYCLLRKIYWAYPYALGLLGLFLVYQVYALVTKPTVWMAVFTVLDAVIIYLVYKEYREITAEKREPAASQ